LASKGENKPTVVSLQHGGHYGTAKYNSVEEHEIDVSDYLFSWGWSNNVKVIPSYLHKHLVNSFKKNKLGSNLVFINYSWSKHDYRISPTIMSTEMESYIENQKIFFLNIKNNVKRKLRIRFYVEDYDWGIKERLINYIDDSNISRITYMKDLKRARIVVPTYNSTTILETLAFNIPTVTYFDPDTEKFNDNASKYFEMLSYVGILHYDPLSAANFINSIWDDVETWWHSEDVKKAKKSFVKEFANLNESSADDFFSQLIRIYKAQDNNDPL
jgi:putative transferase (TIGR04331 family)